MGLGDPTRSSWTGSAAWRMSRRCWRGSANSSHHCPCRSTFRWGRQPEGSTVPSASREKSFLWLGDAACARHAARLRHDIGITHIVNCADACNHHYDLNQTYADLGITVLRLEAEDEPGFPMLAKYLDRVQGLSRTPSLREESTKVMIHCTAGINRSGVLVAALVMLKYRISVLDTVRHIRRRRGNSFLWNETFQEDLVALARTHGLLGDTPTGAPGCHRSARVRRRRSAICFRWDGFLLTLY